MTLAFTTYLPRGTDAEIEVHVDAIATWNVGTPGTLSDVAGWEIEILDATDTETGLPVDLSDDDLEILNAEAAACL